MKNNQLKKNLHLTLKAYALLLLLSFLGAFALLSWFSGGFFHNSNLIQPQLDTVYADSTDYAILANNWKTKITGFDATTLTKITFENVSDLSGISGESIKDTSSILECLAVYTDNEITIYFTSEKLALPVNSRQLFYGLTSLTAIDGMNLLYTNNVTNMYYMFYNCRSLLTLNITTFNTHNVISMQGMFSSCEALQSLNLSCFDTSNVQIMSSMFYNCKALQSLNLSSFNTSSVTDITGMFDYCKTLHILDLHNFDMRSLTSGSKFLRDNSSLAQIICPYNVPEEINIPLGKNFYKLNDSNITTELTSSVCSTLSTSLSLYTSKTPAYAMLINSWIDKLTAKIPDFDKDYVSKIKFEKVADLSSITDGISVKVKSSIEDCLAVYENNEVTIYFTSEKIALCEYASPTFSNLGGLTTIEGMNLLDTSNVTSIGNLIMNTKALISLDLSSCDMASLTSGGKLYANGQKLTKFICPYNIPAGITLTLGKSFYRADDQTPITELTSSVCSTESTPLVLYSTPKGYMAKLSKDWKTKITGFDATNLTKIVFNKVSDLSGIIGESVKDDSNNGDCLATYADNIVTIYFTSEKLVLPEYSSALFSGLNNLTKIEGMNLLDTSNVTNMSNMFSYCQSLQSLDLHNFDMTSVTIASYFLYSNGQKLTKFICPYNIPAGITLTLGKSFYRADDQTPITELTSSVCSTESTPLVLYSTPKGYMAKLSKDWKTKITGFDATNLTKIVFNKVSDLSGIIGESVKDDSNNGDCLATYADNIVTIYFTSEKLVLPENSAYLFSDFFSSSYLTSLTTIDGMNLLDTSNVTNMSNMFSYCQSLQSLDLSNFNVTNVKGMSLMFYGCNSLQSLDLSNFNTSNVNNMSLMFYDCKALQSLDLSSFNTNNVSNMHAMFGHCQTLPSLDLSSFNTNNVNDMSSMFYNCKALQSLNLSSFNTSSVTDMNTMFGLCQALQSLNLSNFDTSNVTDITRMFDYCKTLHILDLHNFDMRSLTSGSKFLRDNSSLAQIICPYNVPEEINIPLGKNFYKLNDSNITTELTSSVCSTLSTSLTLYFAPTSTVEKPEGNSFVFNGNSITFIDDNDNYIVLSGINTATNVGTYTLTIQLKPNRLWTDLTIDNINISFSITQGQATISLSETAVSMVYGETTPEIIATTNLGEINQIIKKTGVIVDSITDVGVYEITYRVADNFNYLGDTKTGIVTVTAKPLSLTIKNITSAYDSPLVELTLANVIQNIEDIPNELSDEDFIFTKEDGLDAGFYDITATCINNNYGVSFSSGIDKYEITKKIIHFYWINQNSNIINTSQITITKNENNCYQIYSSELTDDIDTPQIKCYLNETSVDEICPTDIGVYMLRTEILGENSNYEFIAPESIIVKVKNERNIVAIVMLGIIAASAMAYGTYLAINIISKRKILSKGKK